MTRAFRDFLTGGLDSIPKSSQNLRNPVRVPISHFSSTTNQSSFTVRYLMNSCGLSADKALAASKRCSLKTAMNADSVLALLTTHGFTKTQIRELITRNPAFLWVRTEKILQPKIKFLVDFGLSSTQLAELIVSQPYILTPSLQNRIVPSFNLLNDFLHNNETVIQAVRRSPRLIGCNLEKSLLPNISLLQKHGIPNSNIFKFLEEQPRKFVLEADRFSEIVRKVKELGFDSRPPSIFIEAICSLNMSQSKWEAKSNAYRSFGWSEMDVLSAFQKRPRCMIMSEEKIMRFMNFFQNKLGLKPSDISSRPDLLLCNLERRIMRRCAVVQVLASNNLIGKDLTLAWLRRAILLAESKFLEKYVTKHQDKVPEILKAYEGKIEFSKLNIKF